MADLTYLMDGRLYVNLTSRCALRCRFCFKWQKRPDFFGHELLMAKADEPTVDEVDAAIAAGPAHRELVFCGLGEPLERIDDVVEIATRYKARGGGKVRVNTSGVQARVPDDSQLARLAACIDGLAISLNAPDAETYTEVCEPAHGRGFSDVLQFVERSKRLFGVVVVTAVEYPGVDLAACRRLAARMGVSFGVRPYSAPGGDAAAERPPPVKLEGR